MYTEPTPHETVNYATEVVSYYSVKPLLEDREQVMPDIKADSPTKFGSRKRIDWSGCPAVERIPGRVSGQWIVKGTRIPVDAIIQNYDAGYSVAQLSTEIFEGLSFRLAAEIIEYAAKGS